MGVKRLGDQDLVTVVKDALKRNGQRLAAAGGDEDLTCVKVHVQLVVVAFDRFDQLGDTGGGGVGEDRLLKLPDRLEEGRGSLNVRLTDVQMIDADASLFSRYRERMELTHGGKTAFFNFAGKLHNKFPPEKMVTRCPALYQSKNLPSIIIKQVGAECNRNRRKMKAPFCSL